MRTRRTNHALAIEIGDSDAELALAGEALSAGERILTLRGSLLMRRVHGQLLCAVIDPAPSERRCENEYEVLVENTQRALEGSRLATLLPPLRRRWVVVADKDAETAELWHAP